MPPLERQRRDWFGIISTAYHNEGFSAGKHYSGLSGRAVTRVEPIPEGLTAEESRHVLGAQAQIWTEYLPTPGHVEYMAFPRLIALAEVTWSPKERKNYPDFLARLGVHEERLQYLQVNFRPTKKAESK